MARTRCAARRSPGSTGSARIAPEVCQPFDLDRKGILTGEGAGLLVLESARVGARRGARIYAEVLGYGLNCDADHPVAPDQEQPRAAA